jgi:2-phospho-L-lactate transferase/gluconeogenesis factor (CofD/UPF0052 family)/hydroxymethylpyrimidine pyrophosphatase-like HAD family hydrolase
MENYMKIVILAGGTGSIALQRGLYDLLDKQIDGIDTKVIVNAYDNGLSTGAVRQVMNGKILGPSDVRKNQTTRLELENPKSPWLKFLNVRFTQPSDSVKAFCYAEVAKLESELVQQFKGVPHFGTEPLERISATQFVREAIDAYFRSPIASKIDYNDFSIANIVYAGFASANGNSLRASAKIMASLMGIKDNVLLNDDTSLFLGAITQSGKRITDEGDIVSWGSMTDPFVDVFFTDAEGNDAYPYLCSEAFTAIKEADLIILSSGTQWSSLIPTYESRGFKEAIDSSQAQIVMVMNRQPDKDSPGQGASDIIRILTDRYFPKDRIRLVLDSAAEGIMKVLDDDAHSRVLSFDYYDMSGPVPTDHVAKTHDPYKLALAVGQSYFREFIESDCFVFDYDDTLVGRGNIFPKASSINTANLAALNRVSKVAICTGNSIKAINLKNFVDTDESTFAELPAYVTIYADGGVNKYRYTSMTERDHNSDDDKKQEFIECVNTSAIFDATQAERIIETLRKHHIPLSKIENRGNAMITIKPIDQEYRGIVLELVKTIIKDPEIVVRASGRTTIEIARHNLSKVDAIVDIKKSLNPANITYVGDELDVGNDAVVRGLPGVKCLHVKNPAHTAFFTQVAVRHKASNNGK